MGDDYFRKGQNAEGYTDPTATEAINNITRAEKDADRRAGLLMRIIKDLLSLAGFVFAAPIRLRDRKTGREYCDKK